MRFVILLGALLRRQGVALAAAMTLTGCLSFAPDYERPAIELPAGWAGTGEQSTAAVWPM